MSLMGFAYDLNKFKSNEIEKGYAAKLTYRRLP